MQQIFFIVVSVLLIGVILLQQKGAGLGSMMGGDSGEDLVRTRRGADKFLHQATVLLSILLLVGGIVFMAL